MAKARNDQRPADLVIHSAVCAFAELNGQQLEPAVWMSVRKGATSRINYLYVLADVWRRLRHVDLETCSLELRTWWRNLEHFEPELIEKAKKQAAVFDAEDAVGGIE